MEKQGHEPDNPPGDPLVPLDDPVPGAGFETVCAHFAEDREAHHGAAAVPIYQASTFIFPDSAAWERRKEPGRRHHEYTRISNPTTAVLEAKLARLEHGHWAYVRSSGMGAITAAINACVHVGAHVVATAGTYWPTRRYLQNYLPRFGVTTTFVEGSEAGPFIAAIRPETRLIYLESPTSGYFEVLDTPAIAAAARERGIVTAFDNSWASPYFQQPLDLGCDLVLHSASKYIGGHSDVVAGVVVGRDERLRRLLFREVEFLGAVSDPFASWLLLRGLRTLALRMEQHQRSALAIAELLENHPRVRRVRYPGLRSHPQYELARRQMRGYGSLLSFEPVEQSAAAVHRFMDRTRLFRIGVSWGGHESLVLGGTLFARPSEAGTWTVRLHVGLESTQDLLEDVRQALEE